MEKASRFNSFPIQIKRACNLCPPKSQVIPTVERLWKRYHIRIINRWYEYVFHSMRPTFKSQSPNPGQKKTNCLSVGRKDDDSVFRVAFVRWARVPVFIKTMPCLVGVGRGGSAGKNRINNNSIERLGRYLCPGSEHFRIKIRWEGVVSRIWIACVRLFTDAVCVYRHNSLETPFHLQPHPLPFHPLGLYVVFWNSQLAFIYVRNYIFI